MWVCLCGYGCCLWVCHSGCSCVDMDVCGCATVGFASVDVPLWMFLRGYGCLWKCHCRCASVGIPVCMWLCILVCLHALGMNERVDVSSCGCVILLWAASCPYQGTHITPSGLTWALCTLTAAIGKAGMVIWPLSSDHKQITSVGCWSFRLSTQRPCTSWRRPATCWSCSTRSTRTTRRRSGSTEVEMRLYSIKQD